MKEIPLTQGKIALVDDADYEYLTQWKWCAAVMSKGLVYAKRTNKGIQMHRIIMNASSGIEVDHIDRNGLNNVKTNLRICSHRQNMYNQSIKSNKKASQYKGVHWNLRARKWYAMIRIEGKNKNLGYFFDELDAALVYDAAARIHHGEFARTNF